MWPPHLVEKPSKFWGGEVTSRTVMMLRFLVMVSIITVRRVNSY